MVQKGVIRKRRPSPQSEYARQLAAKQEVKREYGVQDRKLQRYVKTILATQLQRRDAHELLVQRLERRLDNVVFRMGMAGSRAQARQLVSHGHILVNGRRLKIPSHEVQRDDVVGVRPQSLRRTFFTNVALAIKKHEAPSWIDLDKETLKGKIASLPAMQHFTLASDLPLIFEFYSR